MSSKQARKLLRLEEERKAQEERDAAQRREREQKEQSKYKECENSDDEEDSESGSDEEGEEKKKNATSKPESDESESDGEDKSPKSQSKKEAKSKSNQNQDNDDVNEDESSSSDDDDDGGRQQQQPKSFFAAGLLSSDDDDDDQDDEESDDDDDNKKKKNDSDVEEDNQSDTKENKEVTSNLNNKGSSSKSQSKKDKKQKNVNTEVQDEEDNDDNEIDDTDDWKAIEEAEASIAREEEEYANELIKAAKDGGATNGSGNNAASSSSSRNNIFYFPSFTMESLLRTQKQNFAPEVEYKRIFGMDMPKTSATQGPVSAGRRGPIPLHLRKLWLSNVTYEEVGPVKPDPASCGRCVMGEFKREVYQYNLLEDSSKAKALDQDFGQVSVLGDARLVQDFIRQCPFHVDACLVMSEILRMANENEQALIHVKRALYVLEINFPSIFRAALESSTSTTVVTNVNNNFGGSALAATSTTVAESVSDQATDSETQKKDPTCLGLPVTCRPISLTDNGLKILGRTLFMYMYLLQGRGLFGTGLEVCKLLWRLSYYGGKGSLNVPSKRINPNKAEQKVVFDKNGVPIATSDAQSWWDYLQLDVALQESMQTLDKFMYKLESEGNADVAESSGPTIEDVTDDTSPINHDAELAAAIAASEQDYMGEQMNQKIMSESNSSNTNSSNEPGPIAMKVEGSTSSSEPTTPQGDKSSDLSREFELESGQIFTGFDPCHMLIHALYLTVRARKYEFVDSLCRVDYFSHPKFRCWSRFDTMVSNAVVTNTETNADVLAYEQRVKELTGKNNGGTVNSSSTNQGPQVKSQSVASAPAPSTSTRTFPAIANLFPPMIYTQALVAFYRAPNISSLMEESLVVSDIVGWKKHGGTGTEKFLRAVFLYPYTFRLILEKGGVNLDSIPHYPKSKARGLAVRGLSGSSSGNQSDQFTWNGLFRELTQLSGGDEAPDRPAGLSQLENAYAERFSILWKSEQVLQWCHDSLTRVILLFKPSSLFRTDWMIGIAESSKYMRQHHQELYASSYSTMSTAEFREGESMILPPILQDTERGPNLRMGREMIEGTISVHTNPLIAFFATFLPWNELDRSGRANVYTIDSIKKDGALYAIFCWKAGMMTLKRALLACKRGSGVVGGKLWRVFLKKTGLGKPVVTTVDQLHDKNDARSKKKR